MSYALQVEWMETKEIEHFDRNLPREPGSEQKSMGVSDLMKLMGGGKRAKKVKRRGR